MTRRLLLLGAALTALAGTMPAQDIEVRATVNGVALPQGYFDRIARDPHFFEIKRGWTARTRAAMASVGVPSPANLHSVPVTGTLRVVVIPALMVDSPVPDVTAAQIQATWFDGPNPFGTMTQYYSEISRGVFTLTGNTAPWVRTTLTVRQVTGASMGLGADALVPAYLAQAVALADPSIDFGQFDNDGPDGIPNSGDDDGYVDAAAFEEIEVPASCGGPGVWPHRSSLEAWTGQPIVTNDTAPNGVHIKVNDYVLIAVHECANTSQSASVVSHEMGHVLGLPDMYDAQLGIQPPQRKWILGCWSLMAGGSWGCGDGSLRTTTDRPTYDSPWERQVLGWLNVTEVGLVAESTYVLPPAEESGAALRVELSGTEYLFIEYRKQESFDTDLPASGLLVYHINASGAFSPCSSCGQPYYVSIVEAEGDTSLRMISANGGDRGDAGDAFARLGATDSLNGVSAQVLRLNNGSLATVSIDAMRIDASGNALVTLTTLLLPTFTLAPVAPALTALDSVDVPMRAAGGAQPYRWTVEVGTLPIGVSLVSNGRTARLVGHALQVGNMSVVIMVRDALNHFTERSVTFAIGDVTLARDRVLQQFTGSSATPLTAVEKEYLDAQGNRNGKFDVGDLRAWLAGH